MSFPAYAEESVSTFLSRVAAGDAVPGCGSVAALAGAAAAALIATSAQVAKRHAKQESFQTFEEREKNALGLKDELLPLLQKDAELFGEFMNLVYAKNKATGEENAKLTTQAREALKKAAVIPPSIADLCFNIAELALKSTIEGVQWASGDAYTAGYLVLAAVEGCVAIGATNIRYESRYKDADNDFYKALATKLYDILQQAETLKQKFKKFQDHDHVRKFLVT